MSVASEIRDAAVNGDDLSFVLRKCLVFAHKLRYEPFIHWVNHELNGYPVDEQVPLPSYRSKPSKLYVEVHQMYNRFLNYPLPKPPSMSPEEFATMERIDSYESVDSLSSLLTVPKDKVKIELGTKGVARLNYLFSDDDIHIISAWNVVPLGYVEGVLGAIRNKIIDFTLRIETEFPTTDWESSPPAPQIQAAAAVHYHTIILGDVETVSTGQAGDIIREVASPVRPGDRSSLERFLREMGVPEDEIAELNQLLDQNRDGGVTNEETKSWARRVGGRIGESGGKTLVSITTNLLTQAIMKYGDDIVDALPF